MEDGWLDGCWCLWLLIETVYSQEGKGGREMLTVDCERFLRTVEALLWLKVCATILSSWGHHSLPPLCHLQLPHVLVCSPFLLLSSTSNKLICSAFLACLSPSFKQMKSQQKRLSVCPFLLHSSLGTVCLSSTTLLPSRLLCFFVSLSSVSHCMPTHSPDNRQASGSLPGWGCSE